MITVVVGGQFGSEGKGKVSHFLAAEACVRTGGPNAGHTVNGVVWRSVCCPPTPEAVLIVPPGAIVNRDILINEAKRVPNRILLDGSATLMRQSDVDSERLLVLAIASTQSGTGAATSRRVMRDAVTADSIQWPTRIEVTDTVKYLLGLEKCGGRITVEGTQGFGLSLFHGDYPFCTSRDTTAQATLSACGLPYADRVVVVVRTFPIRVGGNSGPLPHETTWEELGLKPEFGSVTGRKRRVARFDLGLVQRACAVNGATDLAVTGLDRISEPEEWIGQLESGTGIPVSFVCYGQDHIERRLPRKKA